MVDATYVKVRELTLSFDVPSRFTNSLRLNGLQLSLIGRNDEGRSAARFSALRTFGKPPWLT